MANDITTEDQEMGGAMKLSKSAIRRAYWDWMFYNLSVQNFERMQGPAIIKMLADVREDPYPGDPEAQQEMLERHEVFFNTEPYLGSIVPGIVLGMEASKAEGNDEISSEFINSIKTALSGALRRHRRLAARHASILDPALHCPGHVAQRRGHRPNLHHRSLPGHHAATHLVPLLLRRQGRRQRCGSWCILRRHQDKVTRAAEVVGLIVAGAICRSTRKVQQWPRLHQRRPHGQHRKHPGLGLPELPVPNHLLCDLLTHGQEELVCRQDHAARIRDFHRGYFTDPSRSSG